MKLASSDVWSILSAILWLMIGISMLWYANRRSAQGDALGKILSFWGLSLLVNAALAAYIPDGKLAVMICLAIFFIGFVLVFLWYLKNK